MIESTADQLGFIFSSMEDAVCVTDASGRLCYANRAALRLLGIPENEMKKEKIWELFPFVEENDELIQLFIDAVTNKQSIRQALVNYENHEHVKYQMRVSLAYTSGEERMLIIVMSDLTDLIRVSSAFMRYTSPDIASYVLESPEGEKQGGILRDVSILMSDLRGFTAMSAGMTPGDTVTLLNHYFEKMAEIIAQHHGTVIEFLGDGIFTVFGAPREDDLHAFHAVACAISMQNAMREVNEWGVRQGFPELEMGIGINSGPCVVGNIGSAQKMKYGCMGNTVNIAGRTESLTTGGQIFATGDTRLLLGDALHVKEEHRLLAKGGAEPVTVCEVTGLGDSLCLEDSKPLCWKQPAGSPVELSFHLVNGKAIDEGQISGFLTGLSGDGRFAMLRTDKELADLQDIVIDIGDSLYAKVVEREADRFRIRFTAKPSSFDKWAGRCFGG